MFIIFHCSQIDSHSRLCHGNPTCKLSLPPTPHFNILLGTFTLENSRLEYIFIEQTGVNPQLYIF